MERFSALVFVGDDISRAIYIAFNMLLREDLAFGGLQNDWNDADREDCKCDNQFMDKCSGIGVKSSSEEIKSVERQGHAASSYYCERRLLHNGEIL